LAAAAFGSAPSARAAADPPADFAGAFVSLDLGYGFGASGDWCSCTFLPPLTDATEGEGGIIIGGGLGYDIRLGSFVLEGAVRAGHADIKFSETCGPSACGGELAWLAEAHVGAGLIVFDDILIAGTYGYAFGDVHAQVGTTPPSTALHDGSTYTARIEQAWSGGWRMGLEYRHYEMGGDNELPLGEVAVDWSAQAVALVIHYELPN
jgi:opacity protein-like surface antigen